MLHRLHALSIISAGSSAASHSDLLHHIAAAVHITLGILDHALNHLAADPACIAAEISPL